MIFGVNFNSIRTEIGDEDIMNIKLVESIFNLLKDEYNLLLSEVSLYLA
jgi:hypothetical protein